jgi:transcription termination factor Rho
MKLARFYRKQFLQLKAEQQRQALRQELKVLVQPMSFLQAGLAMSQPKGGVLAWLKLARFALRSEGIKKHLALALGVVQIVRFVIKKRS